jgi:hypothetical protein
MSLQKERAAQRRPELKEKVMTITAVTGFAVNSSLPRARISKQRKSSATEGNLYKRINNFNYCDSNGAENKTLVESFASEGALLSQQILTFSPTSATFFSHRREAVLTPNLESNNFRLSWFITFLPG